MKKNYVAPIRGPLSWRLGGILLLLLLSLPVSFCKRAKLLSQREPAGATAAAPPNLDDDGDSVPDSTDKCPGTPAGVAVDEAGCPLALDADGDGVPDLIDKPPSASAASRRPLNLPPQGQSSSQTQPREPQYATAQPPRSEPPIIEDFEQPGRFAASLPDTIAWASTTEWRLSIVAGPLGAATNTVTDSALLVTVRRDGQDDTLGALPVTHIMKAYLKDVDDAFKIDPESVQEKAVGHRRHRLFTWLLTPKKVGTHLLRLQIVKSEPGRADAQVAADEYTLLKRRVVVPRSLAYWQDAAHDSVKDYWLGWCLALLGGFWAWLRRSWLSTQRQKFMSRPYHPPPPAST